MALTSVEVARINGALLAAASPCFSNAGSVGSWFVCSTIASLNQAVLNITPQYPIPSSQVIGGAGDGIVAFSTTESDVATGAPVSSFSILTSNTDDGRLPIGSILLDKLIAGSHDGTTVVAWSPPIKSPGERPLFQTYINPSPYAGVVTGYMNDTLLNPAVLPLNSTSATPHLIAPDTTVWTGTGVVVASFGTPSHTGFRSLSIAGPTFPAPLQPYPSHVTAATTNWPLTPQGWLWVIAATNTAPGSLGTVEAIPTDGTTTAVVAPLTPLSSPGPGSPNVTACVTLPASPLVPIGATNYLTLYLTNTAGFLAGAAATDWANLAILENGVVSCTSVNALPRAVPDTVVV